MDDALQAYNLGCEDGAAGHPVPERAEHPDTGPDYRIGVVDGRLAAFQAELTAEVRRALDLPDASA